MTICSFGTPIFNIKCGTLYIYCISLYIIDVINGKFLAHKHSHKKNYNRKRDFS